MFTYQLFSKTINSEVQLTYDSNGRLKGVLALTDAITVDELVRCNWFASVPPTVGQMKQMALKNKIVITEILPDLSFETFWKKYANTNGSKKKAEAIWAKFDDKKRNLAINYIKKYIQSLGQTTQAYATTYLNGEYWDK